ncbi:Vegetative incompatibility protein HET-E-1 [Ceratobasidium theobromae]|uniref:Vegetative incompatibility protein HET-E-1 n=1 Tax=Ceratobasidium theobromae TaxID=1582974 RepID=A0A5N5QGX0_9AGAM|nr:Vegetative incompatibility protein HET-E-1 [Ceratobasidium theobromae]
MLTGLEMAVNMNAWSTANDQLADIRFRDLNPAFSARFNSVLATEIGRRTCTEQTRKSILSDLNNWCDNPDSEPFFWMDGMAGTGKTTIACTLAAVLESRQQLAASFFCTRTLPECRDASRIVPTIAYQLARYSDPLQSALFQVLEQNADIATRDIALQFERLLTEPLQYAKNSIPGNLVVVIDALDECENQDTVKRGLQALFKFRSISNLPIKFFITSRPEPEIYDTMMSQLQQGRIGISVLHLHEIEKPLVQADIELYLREELMAMSPSNLNAQIIQLAKLAGNLFVYAAVAVRYIHGGGPFVDPDERLAMILYDASELLAYISQMYHHGLVASFNEELEGKEAMRIRSVLWAAACAREPVSIETLTMLAGTGSEDFTLTALKPLRSILHISEPSNLVSVLHPSFRTFIFDQEHSREYFCNEAGFNQVLARRCFEMMTAQLRFNICDLQSSFTLDKDVGDLDQRIAQNISAPLAYACRYWAEHLKTTAVSEELCEMLKVFLSHQLLFWMEAMNLKQWLSNGVRALSTTLKWFEHTNENLDLIKSTRDAQAFVTRFIGAPISLSTPHIYISALPLSPKSSEMFKQYRERARGLIDVRGTLIERAGGLRRSTWKTESEVSATLFSPDGTRVVSGSRDGMIALRDTINGVPVVGPFRGHNGPVWSIACSPDGTRIASGSDDGTVRLWDAMRGMSVAAPFKGHVDAVLSVAYSPDNTRIVSASRDGTIQVWDAGNGVPMLAPLEDHHSAVFSVAFSPDGRRIASGSLDRTIRLWDPTYGIPDGDPLRSHTDAILTLAFSPNGERIVSGSRDCTIRLWSVPDKALIAPPLQGHTGGVLSVAFSPDGAYIISGSLDGKIQLWDATDGTPASALFQGHTKAVMSVAFSPSGTHFVSGSFDHTIRLWDVANINATPAPSSFQGHTDVTLAVAVSPNGTQILSGSSDHTMRLWNITNGTPIGDSFQGHTDVVSSVAFSLDGACIASGSQDYTICVWDAIKGTPVSGPFEGHTDAVLSVVFSPDSRLIASGSSDYTIRLWDVATGIAFSKPFKGHTNAVSSVQFSPDGTLVVSGSSDHTIRLWRIDGSPACPPFQGHTNPVISVAFSPDNTRIVSGSEDCTIRLWDVSGAPVGDPPQGHTNAIISVSFLPAPDGMRIISCSRDCTVRQWNMNGDQVAEPFHGHTKALKSAAFSADGRYIACASEDRTIQVFNTNSTHAVRPWDIKIDSSGWVTNAQSERLFWIPPEIRNPFLVPHNPLIITPEGTIQVTYPNVLVGPQWVECYPKS